MKSFDSSSPYVKFDYTWIIVHDFLRPCVNIAINFLQNLNLSLFTTDIFPEKNILSNININITKSLLSGNNRDVIYRRKSIIKESLIIKKYTKIY